MIPLQNFNRRGPIKPLIYAAGDVVYCEKYGRALENSAREHGLNALVDCSGETVEGEFSKAYHTLFRFLKLPELLRKNPAVLVLDLDSIINEPIEFADRWDLGIFFRPEMETEKKVLASAFYIKNTAIEFAIALKIKLERVIEIATAKNNLNWHSDQLTIWKLYLATKEQYRVKLLNTDFINWHPPVPATIWTGKGGVKRTNQHYIKRLIAYGGKP